MDLLDELAKFEAEIEALPVSEDTKSSPTPPIPSLKKAAIVSAPAKKTSVVVSSSSSASSSSNAASSSSSSSSAFSSAPAKPPVAPAAPIVPVLPLPVTSVAPVFTPTLHGTSPYPVPAYVEPYAPNAPNAPLLPGGANPALASVLPELKKSETTGKVPRSGKKFLRVAAGKIWEDQTLQEWPENDFRIFAGDLGNEVNDQNLAKAFSHYPSFAKAKVIRDKTTGKTKGFGFISFTDPHDCAAALKEMDGKYIGNRPIKLRKSTWGQRDLGKVKKTKKNRHLF